ncbi:MAG: hypothetical protein KJ799_13850 [Bacteroidetes bacterium]|nr:hypothetical protein [Bacteroidota bacterium]MBU1677557.1 hypothetical protein [Bacteroidota bacterium]MBU2507787.1 hypothetical protein [Bacteroidota bacterium]
MWTDPIVEEVRKHRREIEKACDNDFDKLFKRIKEREKKFQNRLVTEPMKDLREKDGKTA